MSVTRSWHVSTHVPSPMYNNYMSRTRICYVKSYDMSVTRRWHVFRYLLSLEWHLQFHDMNMACCTIWHENAHVPGTSRRHVLICFSCTGATLAIQGSRSGQKLILENKWINMEAWGEHKVLPLILNLITCYFCNFVNFI